MSQLPHITVATIVERDGRFLMVKENSNGLLVYNQPAGHVEANESLFEAARRETLEETGWRVELKQLLGVYQYRSESNDTTYIRHCFIADAIEPRTEQPLDADIVEALWLDYAELQRREAEMRSPLVLQVLRDYLAGVAHPLDVIAGAESGNTT